MTRDALRAQEVQTAPSHGVGREATPTLSAGTDPPCEGAPRCSSAAPLGPVGHGIQGVITRSQSLRSVFPLPLRLLHRSRRAAAGWIS